MNTDKLMELEAAAIHAKAMIDHFIHGEESIESLQSAHDRLVAALRAEQAVGDEQRARELLAEELRREGMHEDAYPVGCGGELTPYAQAAIRAIRRALGTARQSEGVGKVFGMEVVHNPKLPPDSFVLVPREPTLDMKRAGSYAVSCLTHDGAMVCYRAMLAAAPGGEGEG